MKRTPSPSRLCLDTSPPVREGEDTPAAVVAPILSPHEVGERWPGEAGTERGIEAPSRSRRMPGATARARVLRWVENSAEGLLWIELQGRKLGGFHFTRQHYIKPYYADFCCRKRRLVVEIDGSQHADSSYDRRRDEFMRFQGYSTLRFWNHDVLKHRAAVCDTILAALDGRLSDSVTAPDLRFVFALRSERSSPSPRRTPSQ